MNRTELLAVARYKAVSFSKQQKNEIPANRPRRNKTDYQLLADAFGVSVWAVKQAIKVREHYPNNKLIKAYDELQEAKRRSVKNMASRKRVAA